MILFLIAIVLIVWGWLGYVSLKSEVQRISGDYDYSPSFLEWMLWMIGTFVAVRTVSHHFKNKR